MFDVFTPSSPPASTARPQAPVDPRQRLLPPEELQALEDRRAHGAAADRDPDRLGDVAQAQPLRLAILLDGALERLGLPLGRGGEDLADFAQRTQPRVVVL